MLSGIWAQGQPDNNPDDLPVLEATRQGTKDSHIGLQSAVVCRKKGKRLRIHFRRMITTPKM